MPQRWLAVGSLFFALLLLGTTSPTPTEVEPVPTPGVASDPARSSPDTLRADAAADTPLILSLPAELSGAPVTRYTLLQGPSLSGVAGRSFTWIPKGAAPGTHDVRLHAHRPNAQPDTLVVQIELVQ